MDFDFEHCLIVENKDLQCLLDSLARCSNNLKFYSLDINFCLALFS